jgi:hypothetical protein
MSHTITVRLTKELAAWLAHTAAKTGMPEGKIVRDELEKARTSSRVQAFMRLAGVVRGPKDLSAHKGFSARLAHGLDLGTAFRGERGDATIELGVGAPA